MTPTDDRKRPATGQAAHETAPDATGSEIARPRASYASELRGHARVLRERSDPDDPEIHNVACIAAADLLDREADALEQRCAVPPRYDEYTKNLIHELRRLQAIVCDEDSAIIDEAIGDEQ